MILTLKQIRIMCPENVPEFRALFGESVEVTEELAAQHTTLFSYLSLCGFLKGAFLEECQSVRDTAWAENDNRPNRYALAEFTRVCAVTFARLYNEQGEPT